MVERPRKRQKVSYPLVIEDEKCGTGKRTIRSRREHLAVKQGKRVECANTLSLEDFGAAYLPKESALDFVDNDMTGKLVGLFTNPVAEKAEGSRLEYDDNSASVLSSCRDLIENTSKNDYLKSEAGWSSAKKWKEMTLPDMKYYVLRHRTSFHVEAFVSFMVTYEDGHEVLYVYEVHVGPDFQGKGIGPKLMAIAERIGKHVGLEKVMLTVFRSNTRAIGMYERLGYLLDEYSPQPRTLRNGTLKESSYVILSKSLKESVKDIANGHEKA